MKDSSTIVIRPLTLAANDTKFVVETRNLPEVKAKFYSDATVTPETHLNHFKKAQERGDMLFIIEKDGERIGLTSLVNIDYKNKKCEWGNLLVHPNVKGRGIGAFIEYNILDYAFSVLKMEKIYCEVLTDNLEVQKLHKYFGFKEEGLFREHIIKNGIRRNIFFLGILKSEWNPGRFKAMFGERILVDYVI